APDPAVQQDLDTVPDGGDDLGQDPQRGRHAVELPPAVVGHDDGAGADVDGAPGVVGGVHALHDDRAVPGLGDPGDVVPGHRRGGELGADVGVRHRALGQQDVREVHGEAVAPEVEDPPRLDEHLGHEGHDVGEAPGDQLRRAVAHVALAHAGD